MNLSELIQLEDFLSKYSKDIPRELLKYSYSIKRHETIQKFQKIFQYPHISIEIEKGIYEYSILTVMQNQFQSKFVVHIYHDKTNEILHNLQNPTLENTSLYSRILEKDFNPRILAFFSPSQVFPEQWKDITEKLFFQEETESNVATTDIYKCSKCKESKCKVYQLQSRSADETMTNYIQCTVCKHVFKL